MDVIDLNIDKNNPEKSFIRVANELMNRWVIQSGEIKYRIAEVEFYYTHEKDIDIDYTHGNELQKETSHKWYFHGSGIDITMGNGEYYGGILIRAIYDYEKNIYYYGPLVLIAELFKNFSHVNKTNLDFGLVQTELGFFEEEIPIAAPRVGLNPNKNPEEYKKDYRFLIMPKRKHAEKTRIEEAMKRQRIYKPEDIKNIWG